MTRHCTALLLLWLSACVVEAEEQRACSWAISPLGDSIAVGGQSTGLLGWKKYLGDHAREEGYRTHNVGPNHHGAFGDNAHAGLAGDTLQGMTSRLATDVAFYRPDFLVLHGGTNGIGEDRTVHAARAPALLAEAHALMPDLVGVVLVAIPERVNRVAEAEAFNATLDGACAASPYAGRCDVAYPGVTLANVPDGVHPNDEGHRMIADAVWPLLRARIDALEGDARRRLGP